jgi:F420-non-reducing hydrogenase small subunit
VTGKPKVAFYWCAGCGGCDEAVVDLGARILDIVNAVEIVFWPVALDFKRRDVEALPDGSIAATFLNGAIRSTEQSQMARLLRAKSQLLVAFGSCAHMGGIPGLANLWSPEAILRAVYLEMPSTVNPGGTVPCAAWRSDGHELELPVLLDTVQTLAQVVDVDYYLPGCPPVPKLIGAAVEAILSGTLPARGSVLAPDTALCEECSRRETRPEQLSVAAFKRPHQLLADAKTCLLAQGLLCLGLATRGGCEARCIQGNMPCTGCFGPTSRVRDFGAKALCAIASSGAGREPAEVESSMANIPDPLGTFYRYSLATALSKPRAREVDHVTH